MAQWIIYGSNGVAKAKVKELELHDEWMAECFLTISVKSATPIAFAVGDYIDYRGERYTIQYDPNVLKKASSSSYGEGFTYDNIKFVGLQDEIVRCDFNDIVLSDNNIHYTALPTFPFYCASVDDLLDRIQANLEDLYPGMWIVIGLNTVRNNQRGLVVDRQEAFINAYKQWIDPTYDPTGTQNTEPYGKQDVAEQVDNVTCWDALKKVHDDFDLNFIIRGRVVIVGTTGVMTPNTFQYGKGNGLKEIERVGDSEQQIVTRLRAYGSDENLPSHYYAEINMLPYGINTAAATDAVNLDVDFKVDYFTNEFSSGQVSVKARIGDTEYNNAVAYMNADTGKIIINFQTSVSVAADTKVYITDGVKRDMWPSDHKDYAEGALPDNMAVSRLMLPGFPNKSLKEWICGRAGIDSQTIIGRIGPETIEDVPDLPTDPTDPDYDPSNVEKNKWRALLRSWGFSTDKHRPYIDSPNKSKYGIRPASIYFDGSGETENIHPTIEGMTYGNTPIDEVYASEKITDNGVYSAGETVPNFKITLPNLGFDLRKYYEDGASIDMKSGMCGARSFKMAGKPTQDSNNRWECEVERVHDEALDLWFPYDDFQIHGSSETGVDHGDKYVLIGIDMPDEYIAAAAVKLLEASINALAKNHAPRYTYQPKIDNIWMQRQDDTAKSSVGVVSLHDTLKAGDVFSFADSDLGVDANIIIDVLTIKENADNGIPSHENGIPSYEVTLRDEKQVGTIQKIANKVESIFSGAANLIGNGGMSVSQVQSLINRFGDERFLSKLNDDTAAGLITLLKGLQVGNQFVSGLLGEGGVFRKEADGTTYLEADKMYIRMKAILDTLEVRKYIHSGGNRIASPANCKCVRVEGLDSNGQITEVAADIVKYRCYFRGSDGDDTITNDFVIGDQAYCHITNVSAGSLYQHSYWRLVIGKSSSVNADGEHYIDLSNAASETISGVEYSGYQSGSDAPLAQDDIIQLGNVNDSTRRGAIIEYVSGANAPSYQIYQDLGNIGSASTLADKQTAQYSLNNKNYIGLGYDSSTGRAYMNVHGDFRFGSANDNGSYIKYNAGTSQLDVKAKINAQSTIGSQSMPDYIKANQNNYDDSALVDAIGNLQDQIDGAIDTWFYDYMPVATDASGAPANRVPLVTRTVQGQEVPVEPYYDWYTADNGGTASEVTTERDKHLGDIFYDNKSGYAFRFSLDEDNSVFQWVEITDSAVIKALEDAAKAQDTADHKKRVFTVTPYPPYDVGDLWAQGANGDLMKCKTAKASNESYSASDWDKASKYTDDSAFNSYIDAILNGSQESGDSYVAAAAQRAIIGALGGATVVDGGLLLTSLIAMRKYNGGDKSQLSSYTTWAGISGMFDAQARGNGIAYWAGGAAADMEDMTAEQKAAWDALTDEQKSASTTWAKRLDRFDGSGYFASNSVKWTADGKVYLANLHTSSGHEISQYFFDAFAIGIDGTTQYINPQYSFNHVDIIRRTGAGAVELSNNSVLNRAENDARYITKEYFESLFNAIDANGQKIDYPTTTGIDSIKALFGFWTNQYLSALGQGSDGGGGSTTLAALNDVNLTNLADGQMLVYDLATTHWVNRNIPETYTLPAATSGALGGIKIGYSDTGNNYGIQLDSDNKAYVSVPLSSYYTSSQTDSAISNAIGLLEYLNQVTGGDGKVTLKTNKNTEYVLEFTHSHSWWEILDKPSTFEGFNLANELANTLADYALKSWVTANFNYYELPLAANGTRGGVQIGYTTDAANRNYAVLLSNEKAYVNVPWENTNTWRNILLSGTEKLGTGTNTKGLNFFADGKTTITFLAAGTEEGQSGSANYATIKISSTWRGIQDNLTSDSTTDSLSAKQGKALKGSITTLESYFTNGVANKAEELNTTRTIWGQNFNGTANVSGNMTGVGNITMGSTDGTYIKIGDIYIGYDSTNSAIEIYKLGENDAHVAANLYAHGAISALGQGVDGSGGGQGDVTWALLHSVNTSSDRTIDLSYLTAALTSGGYATQTWVTNQGYALQTNVDLLEFLNSVSASVGKVTLTTNKNNSTILDFTHEHAWEEILYKPSSLQGYGISDVYINNGVINIGGVQVTPLVIGDITDKDASLSYGTRSTIASIGSVDIHVTLPAQYTLPTASSTALGGIQIGFTTNATNRNYAVQLSNNKAYVNVPWTDTVYTHPSGGADTTITADNGRVLSAITVNGLGHTTSVSYKTLAMTDMPSSMKYFNTIECNPLGVIKFTGYNETAVELDFNRDTYWWEILDKPASLAGYGIDKNDPVLKDNYLTIEFFERLFQAYNGTTQVHPNSTSTIDNIKAMFGFWTAQYISALGLGEDGQAGSFNESQMWVALGTDISVKQISSTYLSNATRFNAVTAGNNAITLSGVGVTTTTLDLTHEHSWGEILDKPSTLQGYGIYDTYIEGTTVYINGAHIDVVPSGSVDLTGYAKETWVSANYQIKGDYLTSADLSSYLPKSGGTMTGVISRRMNADTSNYENAIQWISYVNGTRLATIGYHNTVQKIFLNPIGSSDIYNDAVGKYSLVIGNNTLTYNTKAIATQEWAQDNCIPKLDWWVSGQSHDADNLLSGTTFAYSTHNAPTTGTIVAFSAKSSGYTLQLQGSYAGEYLYFRNLNGDNNNTWNTWRYVIHSGNIGDQSVSDSDMLDGYHASSFAFVGSHNNLTASGNEFTTAASGQSGSYYWNYRTAGGLNGSITEYIFCNGNTEKAQLNAASITANGYLYSVSNGITLTIGAQNTSYVHFVNNSSTQYYFDNTICSNGHLYPYVNNTYALGTSNNYWAAAYIAEISIGANRYYGDNTCGINMNNSDLIGCNSIRTLDLSDDYTEGLLFARTNGNWDSFRAADGNFYFQYNNGNTLVQMNTDGLYLNSGWLRTYGSTGWYNESYGGGWYMEDSTWLRSYGGKYVWVDSYLCAEHISAGTSTISSTYALYVSGVGYFSSGVYSAGYVTALSDARHKRVISNTDLTVEQIASMPSVKFKWTDGKHDDNLHVGSLAQNWQQVLPEVVLKQDDAEGTLSLSYGVAALVAAITTARKVVDHEQRIKQLERENRELRMEVERLKIA